MIVMMKRISFVVLLIMAVASMNLLSAACTIFIAHDGDTILAGNNEDFYYTYDSMMLITAPDEGIYGRVSFANSTYVQGGMNEKGLFYDGAMCPASTVPFDEDKPMLGMNLGEIILSKCATVDEAVEMLKNSNIPQGFGDHILFADENGNSAVVEWLNSRMKVVQQENNYQIATNFFLTEPKLGGSPCGRYDMAETMLNSGDYLSIDGFAQILDAVSQDWNTGGTKYSNICDLKNKDFYVYTKGDFNNYAHFNLTDELGKLKQGEKTVYIIDEMAFIEKPIPEAASETPLASQSDEGAKEVDVVEIPQFASGEPIESSANPYNNGIMIIPIVLVGIVLIILIIRYLKR